MITNKPTASERLHHTPPPPDPVLVAKAEGREHRNAATGRTLYHQSVMPLGDHAGKIMERIPADYYLWLTTQKWFHQSPRWKEVRSYIDRHLHDINSRLPKPNPKQN